MIILPQSIFFLKLSTVIGAHGRPMEPVANPVEEAPKPDPGGTTRPYKQALAFQVHLLSPGLAQVQLHTVGAKTVLEALLKTHLATNSVAVINDN